MDAHMPLIEDNDELQATVEEFQEALSGNPLVWWKHPVFADPAAWRDQIISQLAPLYGDEGAQQEFERLFAAQAGPDVSRYDPPSTHSMLTDIAEGALSAAKDICEARGLRFPRNIAFSVLQNSNFDARIVVDRQRGHAVIFFDYGLFDYMNRFSWSVAEWFYDRASPSDDARIVETKEEVIRNIDRDAVASFLDFTISYAMFGSPQMAATPRLDPRYASIAQLLRFGMETFAYAHELAHFALGHLEQAETVPVVTSANRVGLDVNYSWEMELSADALAMEITFNALATQGVFITKSVWLVLMFFYAVEAIDRVKSALPKAPYTERSSPGHPTYSSRRENILHTFSQIPGKNIPMFTDIIRDFEFSLRAALDHIMETERDNIFAVGIMVVAIHRLKDRLGASGQSDGGARPQEPSTQG